MLFFLLACTANTPDPPARPDAGERPGDAVSETTVDTGVSDTGILDTGDHDAGDTAAPDDNAIDPPLGETSGGDGGTDSPNGSQLQFGGVSLWLIAPNGSSNAQSVPLLIVFSGTEGASVMASNMRQVATYYGLEDALIAVLDGRTQNAADGAAALDGVRAAFDVDNDRTWLLSESAGTAAGLELGLEQRQSWFAAYWANDVNTRGEPALTSDALGFAPWGNVGPGGDWPDANAIVGAMDAAGYRLPADAPYSGAGSDTHGSSQQFLAAVGFFADKVRQ